MNQVRHTNNRIFFVSNEVSLEESLEVSIDVLTDALIEVLVWVLLLRVKNTTSKTTNNTRPAGKANAMIVSVSLKTADSISGTIIARAVIPRSRKRHLKKKTVPDFIILFWFAEDPFQLPFTSAFGNENNLVTGFKNIIATGNKG